MEDKVWTIYGEYDRKCGVRSPYLLFENEVTLLTKVVGNLATDLEHSMSVVLLIHFDESSID